VGVFFIDTDTGQVATLRQLVAAGIAAEDALPERPWHRIQGSSDASTLWYAVLRKKIASKSADDHKYVYIGALAIRHQPHHASLLAAGWEEVGVDEIGVAKGDDGDLEADPQAI
jgi:hypothetical protein